MKIKLNAFIVLVLLLLTANTHAQNFRFKRTLHADSAGWNKILIPPQLEAKCLANFADLRIFAIKKNNDSLEAAYTIKDPGNNFAENKVPLKIINRSTGNGSYYYSFQKTGNNNIEEIELAFGLKNFEFLVKLEASHNQKEWFTLLKDYRILSIQNQATAYTFTKLIFSETSYPFYRLLIPATTNPELGSATISQEISPKAKMQTIKVLSQQIDENKALKQTIFSVKLGETLPVSYLQIHTPVQGDFFRPTKLFQLQKELNPSAETAATFKPCGNFTLSSLGSNSFIIPKILTSEIRLVVENLDNEPLKIDSVTVKTILKELWVQLPEAESYVIVYGNSKARFPQYDAEQILEQTHPNPSITAIIGEEEELTKLSSPGEFRWFENDIYLYGLMAIIIALLGYFSIAMMKKK